MRIDKLRNRHRGEDIWLIASGKSLDYVSPRFFDNKITLGINHVYSRFECEYLLVRDHHFFSDVYNAAAFQGAVLLAPEYGFVNPTARMKNEASGAIEALWMQFDVNYPVEHNGMDLSVVGTDEIVGGMSTIHTALHMCAYLGAENIIICGADGGLIDGEKFFTGYRDGSTPNVGNFPAWLSHVEKQTMRLRERLREVYGCEVVSLNPWINFSLEGHTYTHA